MSEPTPYRLSAFVDLTDRERDAMHDMVGPERSFAAAERSRHRRDNRRLAVLLAAYMVAGDLLTALAVGLVMAN